MSSPSALFPPGPDPISESDPEAEVGLVVTVRELRESPRNPERYRIMLSNCVEYVVGIDALVASGATRIGAIVDERGLARLAHAAAVTTLVDKALRSLARGRRTRRELERKLQRVEPNRALIAEALDRLEASGAVSDQEAARAEASSRLRRGEAPTRVRQKLRAKGIEARDTDDAIALAIERDGFDERAACQAQAEKRWRSLASLDPMVSRRRLMAFLLRRGFPSRMVYTVVAEIQKK